MSLPGWLVLGFVILAVVTAIVGFIAMKGAVSHREFSDS